MPEARIVYRAAAVRDATGTQGRPGAIAVAGGQIVAAGHRDDVVVTADTTVIDLPQTLILPVLVNAHAHLDLTAVGPQPYPGDFAGWLKSVMTERDHEGQVSQAVQQGVIMSRHAGVGYLGDIAGGCRAVTDRQRCDGLPGVSYIECVGLGPRQDAAIAQLASQLNNASHTPPSGLVRDRCPDDHGAAVTLGIEPHAPYSAGLELYRAAAKLAKQHGYRLCTHLAETPEEIQFIRDAQGPLADLLRSFGKWNDAIAPTGLHPVEWLEPVLAGGHWLLAHCNYIENHHIEILARCRASVVYCPKASDYFGHHQPQRGLVHRYREMLDANINVCLGTDSIICQPSCDRQPLSIASQMRYLYRRDRTDPQILLSMATINGMQAMELAPLAASLQPGSPARWVGVRIDPDQPEDPLTQALENDQPMALLEAPGDTDQP